MVSRRVLAAWCMIVALLVGSGAVARADQVDNPVYKAWASYKVGSNKTLTASFSVDGGEITIEVTCTLKEVTADHVTIENVSSSTVNGQAHQSPATTHSIAAKADDKDVQATGEEDVDAMGKTFKCKVWTMQGEATGASGNTHSAVKVWTTTDDVPGGGVKIEAKWERPDAQTTTVTYLISHYEAK